MAEQNTEAKLKSLLKQQKIQLWNPPYTQENQPCAQSMQELAQTVAPLLDLSVLDVGGALELIRAQAVTRGRGIQTFRETSIATIELLLPREVRKDLKTKTLFQSRLDVCAQELVHRISEEFGLKSIKLILNGRTLILERTLEEQGVRNHSKMMVLRVSDAEWEQRQHNELQKRQSLQRTHKGFQILSEREEDLDSKPFLEIADQKGNPLSIPQEEKKALIVAMGFHEKGRSLMKRKQFDNALSHLLQADQEFSKCTSTLLSLVDNFAVLQLDIVWCYRALEALSCLDDSRARLQRAETSFLQVYGESHQRLKMIKGSSGPEEVLFLRLYLLQSLLAYIEGNDTQAKQQLDKVVALYSRLTPDSQKMHQLLTLGFSEREARLGLRACGGEVQEAAIHISNKRQEREELKQRERQKRRSRLESVSVLCDLGFDRREAARVLNQTRGDVDQACSILLNARQNAEATNNNDPEAVSPDQLDQLFYLGFERTHSHTALILTNGDVQAAAQLLLENQGVLPPLSQDPGPSGSSGSSGSSGPSGSSGSSGSTGSTGPSGSTREEPRPGSSTEDDAAVSEVLEDISRHEEDYLDLTLEEESELIATLQSYLSLRPALPNTQ